MANTAKQTTTNNNQVNNNLPAKADLKVVKNDNSEDSQVLELKKQLEKAAEKEKFFIDKLAEVQAKAKEELEEAKKPKVLNEADIQKRIEQTRYLSMLVEKRSKTIEKAKELKQFLFNSEEAALTIQDSNGQTFETVKKEILTLVTEAITDYLADTIAKQDKQIASFEI